MYAVAGCGIKWCKSVSNCAIKLVTTVGSNHNLVQADVKKGGKEQQTRSL